MHPEISTDCPARYCRETATAATLDRVCIGPRARFRLDVEVLAEVDINAAAISDSRLSDHTPIVLRLRDRARHGQQARVPGQVCRGPRYGYILGQLLSAAQLDRSP
eukprot:1966130-Pyramimonas_sp.AAC.1